MNFLIIATWVLLSNNQTTPAQSHENTRARCEICSQLVTKIPEQ